MFTYEITHDGWPIGSFKGKKKSVDMLKKRLEWEGVTTQMWDNFHGEIIVHTDKGLFRIGINNS
jgi:hypothetical protein